MRQSENEVAEMHRYYLLKAIAIGFSIQVAIMGFVYGVCLGISKLWNVL